LLKHQTLALEVRSVDESQRIIEGYANAFGVTDSYGTRWTPKTFERTIREEGAQARAFIGHDVSGLPVGKPVEMRIDETGLFTRTLISPGPQGDDLLAKAKFFHEQGAPIGMSVGFRSVRSHTEGGVTVFDDVELREYSFVAFEAVPGSQVTAVRANGDPLAPHDHIDIAIMALTAVRDEIAERADAVRTLSDVTGIPPLSETQRASVQEAVDSLMAVLSGIKAEREGAAASGDPLNELERLLAGISLERNPQNA
jgi:HK97 family phage prohead protease